MEKDYIEHLIAVAGVGGHKISQHDFIFLKEKYHLTDKGMAEMKAYCKEHHILIYDEKDQAEPTKDGNDAPYIACKQGPMEEERIRLDKARLITKHIMNFASVCAQKLVDGKGWLCGTYTSKVWQRIERKVVRKFSESEMDYIIEHLAMENDEDTCFQMTDAENPKRIAFFNDELNSLIPRLLINRYYSDFRE